MTGRAEDRPAAGPGSTLRRAAAGAVALGAAAAAAGVASGRGEVVRAVLDASALFLAGGAAGAVAASAAVRLSHGGWAGDLLPAAEAGAGFFRPALGAVAVLALAAAARASVDGGAAGDLARAAAPLAGAAAAFAPAARFVAAVRAGRDGARVHASAAACLAGFAVGLSIWTAGLVFGRAPGSAVAVLPAASFVAAFLCGLAWVALGAAARGEAGDAARGDLARLLFALTAVWAYLLWSLYLPTWYADVPEASAFLRARWSGPYRPPAAVAFGSAAAALVLLFPGLPCPGRPRLAAAAAAILVASWLERLLLVLPSRALALDPAAWVAAAGAAIGLAGAFLLAAGPAPAAARAGAGPRPRAPTLDAPRPDVASPNGG